MADVAPTILIDGMVIGTWGQRKGKGHLIMEISPFEDLSGQDLRRVRLQADALSSFMDFGQLRLNGPFGKQGIDSQLLST